MQAVIKCDCGGQYRRHYMRRHFRSDRHKNNISKDFIVKEDIPVKCFCGISYKSGYRLRHLKSYGHLKCSLLEHNIKEKVERRQSI